VTATTTQHRIHRLNADNRHRERFCRFDGMTEAVSRIAVMAER
jgi:hypothetical protein